MRQPCTLCGTLHASSLTRHEGESLCPVCLREADPERAERVSRMPVWGPALPVIALAFASIVPALTTLLPS